MVPTLIFEHQQFLSILFDLDSSSRCPLVMRDTLSTAGQSTKHHREIPEWSPASQFFAIIDDWIEAPAK
jgi:hypothetical protein